MAAAINSSASSPVVLGATGLDRLIHALTDSGRDVAAPVVADGVITLGMVAPPRSWSPPTIGPTGLSRHPVL